MQKGGEEEFTILNRSAHMEMEWRKAKQKQDLHLH